MDSLSAILGNKDFSEPEEITKLKGYISAKYNSTSEIRQNPKGLTIVVGSSALASALRLNMPQMKRELNISLPLTIRIR
ncbi:MAG TPA: hypothetical protein VGF75_00850 [Candidatus Saccharimonadales bacterium]|jgi:hypothetical protein